MRVAAHADARVEDDGESRTTTTGHPDDVADLELLEGLRRCRTALAGSGLRQLRLAVLDRGTKPAVLLRIAEVTRHGLAVALERLEVLRDLSGQAHDGLVRLELREARLEQRARRFTSDAADEVDGHVVRRPEARPEWIRARRGKTGNGLGIEALLPQHDRVSLDVDAASPGAAGQ